MSVSNLWEDLIPYVLEKKAAPNGPLHGMNVPKCFSKAAVRVEKRRIVKLYHSPEDDHHHSTKSVATKMKKLMSA